MKFPISELGRTIWRYDWSWRLCTKLKQLWNYHCFRWYATLENNTPAETCPKFLSVLRVIDRLDRNPPITATSVSIWPSLCHASELWLVDFDPICWYHVRQTEILETFPLVFCFPKSRINKTGGKAWKRFRHERDSNPWTLLYRWRIQETIWNFIYLDCEE